MKLRTFLPVVAALFAALSLPTAAIAQSTNVKTPNKNQSAKFKSAIFKGSGNLIESNSVTSSIGGGQSNSVTSGADYAAVGGGFKNVVVNDYGTVGGGGGNTVSGASATVAGGEGNSANFFNATIGGGSGNAVTTFPGSTALVGGSTVGGGYHNTASGDTATVGGGYTNTARGDMATIAGGGLNSATNYASTVAGGYLGTAGGQYAFVGGGSNNTASGQSSFIGGGNSNQVTATGSGATIGGGETNYARAIGSTVVGGVLNEANGAYSAIGGGFNNETTGSAATIPGGNGNFATNYSFAGGRYASAEHDGSFVWGSAPGIIFTATESFAANTFTVRCHGGARFYTASGTSTGPTVTGGSGTWTSLSDRNAKENFGDVNTSEVLAKVAAMPIKTWNYKTQADGIRHIGPTAQDFKKAFGVGESDTGITTVDADGVALAAIQGLVEELKDRDKAIEELKAKNSELSRSIEAINERLNSLPPAP